MLISLAAKDPLEQDEQVATPVVATNVPAGQEVQPDDPAVENVPTEHFEHAAAPVPG
jgi:hypothetical protein